MNKLFVYLIAILIFGCSSGKESIEGTICVVGNEPFSKLALQVDSVTLYKLEVSKEEKDILWKNQGRKAKINYTEVDSTELPKTLKVIKYEILK